MEEIILANGKKVMIYTKSFPGMAGEPMTVLMAMYPNGETADLHDLFPLMTDLTKEAVKNWERDLSDENYHSAISWTI